MSPPRCCPTFPTLPFAVTSHTQFLAWLELQFQSTRVRGGRGERPSFGRRSPLRRASSVFSASRGQDRPPAAEPGRTRGSGGPAPTRQLGLHLGCDGVTSAPGQRPDRRTDGRVRRARRPRPRTWVPAGRPPRDSGAGLGQAGLGSGVWGGAERPPPRFPGGVALTLTLTLTHTRRHGSAHSAPRSADPAPPAPGPRSPRGPHPPPRRRLPHVPPGPPALTASAGRARRHRDPRAATGKAGHDQRRPLSQFKPAASPRSPAPSAHFR